MLLHSYTLSLWIQKFLNLGNFQSNSSVQRSDRSWIFPWQQIQFVFTCQSGVPKVYIFSIWKQIKSIFSSSQPGSDIWAIRVIPKCRESCSTAVGENFFEAGPKQMFQNIFSEKCFKTFSPKNVSKYFLWKMFSKKCSTTNASKNLTILECISDR